MASAEQSPTESTKSRWEKVLIGTPVLFTIVATFLAGKSSGEMTQAQYFRSLASQNQSKVGDQWAFFQAKRIRGTSLQMTAEVLQSVKGTEPMRADSLADSARRLEDQLESACSNARNLLVVVGAAQSKLKKETADPLEIYCKNLAIVTVKAANQARQARKELAAAGKNDSLFAKPVKPKKPSAGEDGVPSADSALIQKAIAAIRNRAPEQTIGDLAMDIPDEALHQAIEQTEARAEADTDEAKKADRALGKLDKWVDEQSKIGKSFLQSWGDVRRAAQDVEDEPSPPQDLVRALRRMERHAEAVKAITDETRTTFKVARLGMTARRYEAEARDNQDLAYLYEIKVHASGAKSDRHLQKSKNFFYGMLAAQVAVTIATLALAVRQKSLLWGLATLAGLSSIVYAGYVLMG
jgi:hypothetical protein